ncbi:hypothetical protein SLS56_002843 [Neofusicoccum ribis]|uniref:amidase n=1 Tax=Neofusicoccum ribis TaxID=45134 RepID=A0ABR3T1M3_9PEZI
MASDMKAVSGEHPASSNSVNGEAKKDWHTRAAEKRAANLAKIPAEWRLPEATLKGIHEESNVSVLDLPRSSGLLTEEELHITEDFDATGLFEQLSTGALTAQAVASAFCKRAAIAHQAVNCLTETFFDQALARAKLLDEFWAREGKPLGPLHGIPISLKDSFVVKDVHHTCGYISFLDRPPATENSPLVQTLLDLGAVLYVKTNIPQTFMTADSQNNIFGRTLNPRNPRLTAGGSSGGEGALLALRGSPLGVGTDVAGSIRIPALCNGLWGLKPTANRVPFGGNAAPGRLGSPSPIAPLAGPLARSARDCALLVRAVVDADPWRVDDTALAVPWRALPGRETKLRLGVVTEDPANPLHPPALRALRSAVARLEAAGHEVVALGAGAVPPLGEVSALAWRFFGLDPAKTVLRFIKEGGEPLIKSLATVRVKENEGWTPSLDGLFDMVVERKKVIKAFHDVVVRERLDAVVLTTYVATAVPHDTYGFTGHTVLANLLDWPAVVLPYGVAAKREDEAFVRDVDYVPPYTPDEVEGMPCSIQVMGRPLRDEELMRDVEIIEKVLRAP